MSLAYPEGECFFKRSALKTSVYDADRPEHFYAHLMVEFIWNRPAFHGSDSPYDRNRHYHPRSVYKVVKGDMWNTRYGNWTDIFFLYGKKPYNGTYRAAEHNLCVNGNRFRDQEKGGSLESWFMLMPMPLLAKGEDWVLIDRLACIRAIYIPVAQQASEDFPEVCTFLQVNFAISREVSILAYPEIWSPDRRDYVVGERWESLYLDATLGMQPAPEWTLAINIRRLVNLLSLPRTLRTYNVFSSESILLVDRKLTPTTGKVQKFSDSADLSWTTVASANYGLTVQWKPPQATTWLADFIKNTMTTAVGFVPFIGPLAAVAFPLAWTAIADPESFEDTLRTMVPNADLAMRIRDEIQKSAKEQQSYVPKEWIKVSGGMGDVLAQPATTAPAKGSGIDEAKRKATVQKTEAIRKFKYWNILKPAGQGVAEKPQEKKETVTTSQAATVQEKKATPEPPKKVSLDDVGPSALFQLATQVLEHSGDNPALKSDTVGSEDGETGAVLEEMVPEEYSALEEEEVENFYDWMAEYIQGQA
ncbi:hypothetical protein N7457_004281 [Penicillium paradoxum]|uniref:uncharacterized protein n=1 Tax=Penicillium paradoxum TaxID=176176 RepID=UPI0025475114|nr:uncharacterized protein N7457_004281 [Penicillium paradoxum]KAJ5782507.1 hypothetical protein N7457_004281 [Penicillium paradoxum]